MIGRGIFAGLDVGTAKVCAVTAEINGKGAQILGIGTSESTGLKKGMVINIDSTVGAIKKAVASAESFSGVKIRSVSVGISGSHIQGFNSSGVAGVRGREVTEQDVERAIEAAKAVYVPLDREVLHVIPAEFVLDGQEGICDPVGMSGVRLEARVYILTTAVSPLQNLAKCCRMANLDIADIVFEPLASADAALTPDEKQFGVILIDIGGGTSDIALFKDGCLRSASVLGIGGAHLTNDIAIGLRVNMHEAERLKKDSGAAVTGIIQDDGEEILIRHAGGQERTIPRRYLIEIIQPRCIEMLEMIKDEIRACLGYETATCGVVLTGGSSLLKGFDVLAESVLGLPVRIGMPGNKNSINPAVKSPVFSTGVGLVTYNHKTEINRLYSPEIFSEFIGVMKGWVKGVSNRLIKFQKLKGGRLCLKLKK